MVFVAVFLAFAASATAAPSGALQDSGLLAAMNAVRSAHGLQPLHLDATLQRAAKAHSLDMLRNHFFAHGHFGGRMLAFHVQAPFEGENLAWGNGEFSKPEQIVAEWLASPEHRRNLLRPGYSRLGIGIAWGTFLGQPGTIVVTADFAGS